MKPRRDLSWAGTSTTVGAKRKKSFVSSIRVRRVLVSCTVSGRPGYAFKILRVGDRSVVHQTKWCLTEERAGELAGDFLRGRPMLEEVP